VYGLGLDNTDLIPMADHCNISKFASPLASPVMLGTVTVPDFLDPQLT